VELLRFAEDGSYALFADQNRYHPPVQRGAWSKESYAVIWLEPYELHNADRVRVPATRVGDRIALTVPDLHPMFALEGPPVVAEDRLLGIWLGERAQLTLAGNRRYAYTPSTSTIDAPATILGHGGRWRIEEGRLLLRPDPPNMGPYQLRLDVRDDDTVLILDERTFRREPDRNAARSTS
jgi:hypothetical protein